MKSCLSLLALVAVTLVAVSTTYADVAISFGDPIQGNVLIPNEATIRLGEVVTFNVHGTHVITIYLVDDNTTRDTINPQLMGPGDYILSDAATIPNPIVSTAIRDAENPGIIEDHQTSFLRFLGAKPTDLDPATVDRDTALSAQVTFLVPGRYLVLCGVKGHLDSGMYGFVTVLP